MKHEIINGQLFYVEFDKGEKIIQEKLCNFLGHEPVKQTETNETVTIHKGVCRRCGYGLHCWKASKNESEKYLSKLRDLC
ncbi:MAG: hypothetical protein IIB80_04415 [Thaumarchaeota archaeon]|nr:hypothetical protein [Nitrososphaerota archaeon]